MQLYLYYGRAGTGKTTLMIKMTKELNNNVVILAPTHSACDNIRRKLGRSIIQVSTIYSYFSIDFSSGTIGDIRKKLHQYIFIDEFSLLDREMMIKLFRILKRCNTNIYLFGDPLQLNPVYDKRLSKYTLVDMEAIAFDSLDYLYGKIQDISSIRHIYQGLFFQFIAPIPTFELTDTVKLTKVYRQKGSLIDEIYAIINDKNYQLLSMNQMIECVNNGYTVTDNLGNIIEVKPHDQYFIASTYALLQMIYDKTYNHKVGCTYKNYQKFTYYLTDGEDYTWIGNNDNTLKNGMIVTLTKHENGMLYFSNKCSVNEASTYYLQPARYTSIHKSQGMTLDNVVMCIDDMFEPSMIYTALTRASNTNMLFNIHKSAIEQFNHQLDLLKSLSDFYYS